MTVVPTVAAILDFNGAKEKEFVHPPPLINYFISIHTQPF
jgi:hypothetical protein